MPESDQADRINGILQRVLNAQNVQGTEHFERIREMLEGLPDSEDPKTIESLLRCRFKVVTTERDDFPVFVTGTDVKDGKYYIGIKSDPEVVPSLPWIVTHELSHILNEDQLTLGLAKTVVSLGMAALSTFVLGWSLLPSLGSIILTNWVTHIVCSQWAERAADDFAIKHSSREELQEGIKVLKLIKKRRASGIYADNLMTRICHPSEDSRIAKIRAALSFPKKERLA